MPRDRPEAQEVSLAEIRNPNQQGGDGQNSHTLLIISIVFVLVFLGMQYFAPKKKAPAEAPAPVTAKRDATAADETPSEPGPAAATNSDAPRGGPAVVAASETTTVVENELYRISFSNRGGQATSWILKKYKDDAGKPLDLVNPKAAAKAGLPLSLWTYDANMRNRLAHALFVPSATGTLNAPATLTFTYSDGGLEVKKAFTFDSTYVLHLDLTATEHGSPVTALVAWPSAFGDQETLPEFCRFSVRHHAGRQRRTGWPPRR